MDDFKHRNLEPIQDVIGRVSLVKKPSYKDEDCSELARRFYDQDWKTQLEICEIWLEIDNAYSPDCLFGALNDSYWGLLQELVDHGIEKAAALSTRVMECAIKHMRPQIIALFVAENATIEIVRKCQKLLAFSLKDAYSALAFRIGGDEDFVIDKDMLNNPLEYFDICAKFNLPVSDEEAIDGLKLYLKSHGHDLLYDTISDTYIMGEISFSLRLNKAVDNWRKAIESLSLNRAVRVFDHWDKSLHNRINAMIKVTTLSSLFRLLHVIDCCTFGIS